MEEHDEFMATVVEAFPWGSNVQLSNGEIGFLDNSKNPQWLNEASDTEIGVKFLVVVLDETRDPVRVSALQADREIARRLRGTPTQ